MPSSIKMKICFLSSLACLLLLACGPKTEEPPSRTMFELLPSQTTGIAFENTLTHDFKNNIFEYDYFYNGSGVAAADFNNDGLTDLFFNANQVPAKLYLNKGNFVFEDHTEKSGIAARGWGTGVSVADVNQDGRPDIYVCHAGLKHAPNQLFINEGLQADGALKFTERANAYGIDYTGFSTQAAFFDYDKDGDLDMYLLNHFHAKVNPNYPKDKIRDGTGPSNDKFFKNENGKFIEVSKQVGITTEGFGLGIAIADLNDDGWPDIYIANDFAYDDLIYVNNQNGTFTEHAHDYLNHTSQFSMGCDVADFNNDSRPDIFVADMLPNDNKRQKLMATATTNDVFNFSLQQGYLPQYSRNALQLNQGKTPDGKLHFSEIGQLAGVFKTDWSWSTLFADLDNDGWKDLFISNGIPHDITNMDFTSYRTEELSKEGYVYNDVMKKLLRKLEDLEPVNKPNFSFKNNADLTFADQSKSWGLDRKGFSNGAALADFDNDGDLDLVTNNLMAAPFVFKNNSSAQLKNNYLNVRFTGHFSQGTKIKISHQGKTQFIDHNLYRGFQSTQQDLVHFGLGADSLVDEVQLQWPDGKYQRMVAIKANQTLTVDYATAGNAPADFVSFAATPNTKPIFQEQKPFLGLEFTHQEKFFEDFNYEPLLPHRFSMNGPYLAIGDVDGNGMQDVWIGGPARMAGKIFFQQKNASFTSVEMPDPGYEDMGGLFFDADNDNDLDLYVVSGGNEYNPLTATYQDRLYLNQGQGKLQRNERALPQEVTSGSCVVAADYDKDGDMDLFVGGRVIPQQYPTAPESILLQNDGKGNFTNITEKIGFALKDVGMVTTALWTDIDNDGWVDLMVAGEWMEITIFKNQKGIFKKLEDLQLSQNTGWWFSLAPGDFDADGDMDYIAGNVGLNNRYQASAQTPLRVYASDFDGNGKIEPILSYYLNGKEYPVAGRSTLAAALPSIKKKFDTYTKFAEAEFSDLFSKEQLDKALILRATRLSSVYIENQGNGHFAMRDLPIEAQFSAIQSIQVKDFDHDGKLDALVAGNFYSPDFMTGRYDASVSLLLKGDGRGNFAPQPPTQSGLMLQGDVRDTKLIKIGNDIFVMTAANSEKGRFFKIRSAP